MNKDIYLHINDNIIYSKYIFICIYNKYIFTHIYSKYIFTCIYIYYIVTYYIKDIYLDS